MGIVGAPEAVLGVAQHRQIAHLPTGMPGKQRLEKLGRIALALDRDAQRMALRRLQVGELARAAHDAAMPLLQRPPRPCVQR